MECFAHIFRNALIAFCLSTILSAGLSAEDLKIKALLVWGTDEKKPEGKDLKQIPEDWRNRMRPLRWKNYYIVKDATAEVAKKGAKLALSPRCTVGFKPIGKDRIEVQLFNPMASTPEQPVFREEIPISEIKSGHLHVMAGDSKDRWDDAWAVFLVFGE